MILWRREIFAMLATHDEIIFAVGIFRIVRILFGVFVFWGAWEIFKLTRCLARTPRVAARTFIVMIALTVFVFGWPAIIRLGFHFMESGV